MLKSNLLVLFMLIALMPSAHTIDLAGQWQFAIGDQPVYDDVISLPGSMLTNGKGNPVSLKTQWVGSLYDSSYYYNPYMEKYRQPGDMKFPFFLTPDRHFVGQAWYKRSVDVPADWKDGVVELFLERPHITTTVYVNGHAVGRDSTLSVPHVFDVTRFLRPGKSNEIVLNISNEIDNVCVGQDSHSVTDQTQGDWNGVVGTIELRHRPNARIVDLQVFPDYAGKQVKVMAKLDGYKKNQKLDLSCFDPKGNKVSATKIKVAIDTITAVLSLGDNVYPWDEFTPELYTLNAELKDGESRSVTFGVRDIHIEGRQFYLNGHPIWMRGTVGNCCFPLTGYPPTDEQAWLDIFNKCKEYGLNSMRFHSYCPPEAAFVAADKVGFYLQPEGPSWPNHGVKLGNGMTIDRYLLEETERMVRAYGNHPSFCMLAAGNEPAGNWVRWVTDFCDYWRSTGDDRRVYCGASVGGGWAFDPASDYHVKGGARGLDWDKHAPQSTDDYTANITSFTQKGRTPVDFEINEPLLSHEQGQWCAFPDLYEVDQYTGAYKARNFEIFADLLRDNGMESQAKKFLMASGRLQTLAYKYEIERNLRTPEYAGFQLLALNDYSGQGTALVGVLNVMWREKGYCNAEDWTRFCAPVVPLARFEKFVYGSGEKINVPVELYNAFDVIPQAKVTYTITRDGNVVMSTIRDFSDIPLGKNFDLGEVVYDADNLSLPSKYTLTVSVDGLSEGDFETKYPIANVTNHWDFWVYPSDNALADVGNVYVADSLDAKAIDVLEKGGNVLLTAAGKVKFGDDVKQTYLPVFWNTSWFKMRPPHTTGAAIDNEHPLFKNFPTDDWTNLNWWEIVNNAQVINLADFPASYQPPIQPIDTWHVSRKLGMIVEANVLNGKLLMTTIDIDNDLDNRLVARQMRNAILTYMQSPDFCPQITLNPQVISDLYTKRAPAVDMFTNGTPDELKPKLQ